MPVEISVSSGTELAIVPATSGKITATSCTAGGRLVSGTSSFSLDGKPLLSLHTATPLYRPLRSGDRGDDVRALQEELRRLGHEIDADGEMGERSMRTLRELFASLDEQISGEQIPWERILWIPQPETAVQRCEAPLGASAAAESPLATASDVPAAASVKPTTPPLVEGPRRIELDGTSIDVPAELRITDPAVLERITASPAYQHAAANAENETGTVKLTATMVLREPIEVAVVPPAAIVGIEGNRGCIVGDGRPVPVTIVGSRLGQSFVDTGAARPAEVQTGPDPATRCEESSGP